MLRHPPPIWNSWVQELAPAPGCSFPPLQTLGGTVIPSVHRFLPPMCEMGIEVLAVALAQEILAIVVFGEQTGRSSITLSLRSLPVLNILKNLLRFFFLFFSEKEFFSYIFTFFHLRGRGAVYWLTPGSLMTRVCTGKKLGRRQIQAWNPGTVMWHVGTLVHISDMLNRCLSFSFLFHY